MYNISHFAIGLNISKGLDVRIDLNGFQRLKDTFAVINEIEELKEILVGMVVERDAYIVRHTESPIFFIHMPVIVTRGYTTSVISQSFGQLAQSGLNKFWRELNDIANLVARIEKGTASKELCRKLVVKRFFKVNEEIMFDEAKSVSLFAVQGIFWLCASVLGVVIVAFIRELIKYEFEIYFGLRFSGRIACHLVALIKLKICRGYKSIREFSKIC